MVRMFSTILLFNLFESKINVVETKNDKKADIFPLPSFKINKRQIYAYIASALSLSLLHSSPLKNTENDLLKQCSLSVTLIQKPTYSNVISKINICKISKISKIFVRKCLSKFCITFPIPTGNPTLEKIFKIINMNCEEREYLSLGNVVHIANALFMTILNKWSKTKT